ncbi:LOW QUALITY PROTEIN: protein-lysine methyltransferase METTL21D-like [Belonocnema kinseyi]|uniref:LOW QUALITY PROTEIN: protein-lysine methyltransferase METTL21D-like n=1 Tax=Belonocnema kinseyi TaxID=2817044 RepID=UPI00143DE274|nr:LOW QUALITY PROTEIN: protein-lysine methyltransferase METTL21D-like [Belonocnema kinseyi]
MSEMTLNNDVFTRELELESCNKLLTLYQQTIGDVSCVVWDAAIVLAKYLDFSCRNNNWLNGKKVLELGAGIGSVGMTAACFGADVLMTDLEKAMPMLNKNAKLNQSHWKKSNGSVETEVLEWGKDLPKNFTPELVLLTDCVYYEESTTPLMETLENLCTNNGTYVLMSQEKRDTPVQVKVWSSFKKSLEERLKVTSIPLNQQHPVYSSSDIDLLKITK